MTMKATRQFQAYSNAFKTAVPIHKTKLIIIKTIRIRVVKRQVSFLIKNKFVIMRKNTVLNLINFIASNRQKIT